MHTHRCVCVYIVRDNKNKYMNLHSQERRGILFPEKAASEVAQGSAIPAQSKLQKMNSLKN